jgi:hypothetical protein
MKLSRYSPSFLVVVALTALFAAVSGVGLAANSDNTGTAAKSSGLGEQAGAAPALQAKKKCKLVKKRVHGKVRKVRVCTKAKPAASLPSRVSVTLDSAHAATASISADSGATLSAGPATLTVPAGAVAETTSVTMTPVTRLGGLRGQLLGAVQVQPDGLRLLRPVTLTIDVPSSSGVQAFSYARNGSDFHLYPLEVEAGKATLKLFHFSGYGVGERLPPPSVTSVQEWFTLAKRAIDIAKRNPTVSNYELATLHTVSALLHWGELPYAVKLKHEFHPSFKSLKNDLAVALRRLADAEHAKCVANHEIVETGKNLNLAYELARPFYNRDPGLSAASYVLEQRSKCERFELDFNSEIHWAGGGAHQDSYVRVQGLQLNYENKWTNQATLDYWSYDGTHPSGCTASFNRVLLRPFKAKLNSVPSDWYERGSPPMVSMTVDVGEVREDYTWHCPKNDVTGQTYFWSLGITVRHGSAGFTINDWEYLGGSVFARRTYSGSTVAYGDIVSEQTTFTLRHTPE